MTAPTTALSILGAMNAGGGGAAAAAGTVATGGALLPILGGISAVASIGSGIAGMFGAKSANKKAQRDQRVARTRAKAVARIANKHNDKLDAADKENYYAMREYSHDTNIQNWKRGKQIQKYKFAQSMREFEKNRQISSDQLDLNASSAERGAYRICM